MINRNNLSFDFIASYLNEIKNILNSDYFNIDTDFSFYSERYKNDNFINKYDYNIQDVIDIIKSLSPEDYSDNSYVNDESDLALIFGKTVKEEIYIKIKIMEQARRKVVCISFHEAEYKMKYPFKGGGN